MPTGSLRPEVEAATPPARSSDGTGYIANPDYLSELAALDQRISNHSLNHIALDDNPGTPICNFDPKPDQSVEDCIRYQVDEAEKYLLPHISNELYTLTSPGGRWNRAVTVAALSPDASFLLHVDPGKSYPIGFSSFELNVPNPLCSQAHAAPGKIHLYVNAWDWCYAALGKPASLYAQDLGSAIVGYTARNKRGFYVFNHDRNDSRVGSTYALDIAKSLIPYLQQQGFVFVGPVIWFSAPEPWEAFKDSGWTNPAQADTFRIADVRGDKHPSVCALGKDGIYCAPSRMIPSAGLGVAPKLHFDRETPWGGATLDPGRTGQDPRYTATFMLADLNHDGKADAVMRTPRGIEVALSNGRDFQQPKLWSAGGDFSDRDANPLSGVPDGWLKDPSRYETFRVADLDGDGYPDICARAAAGIVCALNDEKGGFSRYTLWESKDFMDPKQWSDVRYAATMTLADVNGDGKADLVIRTSRGLFVALSDGKNFGRPMLWSDGKDFSDAAVDPLTKKPMGWLADARYRTFRAADINGDGKSDICAMGPSGVVCALSNGARFLRATNWENKFASHAVEEQGWLLPGFMDTFMLGDLNGDGRADLIIRSASGLLTEFAP
jgi:hypothetical protein